MKYDITHAIQELKPGAAWSLNGDNYSGLVWLDSKQKKPTEAEINAKVAALDAEEPMRLLRIERTKRLVECDWRIFPDVNTSTSQVWLNYRQALRDLPSTASPKLNSDYQLDLTSVTWPTEPS